MNINRDFYLKQIGLRSKWTGKNHRFLPRLFSLGKVPLAPQLMGTLSVGLGLSLLVISSTVLLPVANPEGIFCALYENTSFLVKTPMSNFGEPMEPGIIHCNSNSCCMAVWSIHNGELQAGVLGCFPDRKVCASPVCTPVVRDSVYHCLCSSNMCNANITILHQRISPTQAESERCAHWNPSCDWTGPARERPRNASSFSDHLAVYTAMATLFLVFCVAVLIKALRKFKFGCLIIRKQDELELQEILTQDEDSPPTLPVDGLVLVQALRNEHLAAHLWLGVLHGRGVIIKSYPPQLKELYRNEWKIINLIAPFQHENIVRLLAAGSGTVGSLENHQFLVLQHYPQGSLRNYLTGHTTDWTTACQLAVSLTRGLAFLHTYTCGDTHKPPIAHRDLNSDNVLVTEHSSCIISDFGLSVILERQQMKSDNKQDPAKICMAGTLRYMSPEMLDGFLNLMSLERALTQADVYSLGLLLWEIFFRCKDLYEDRQAPEYQVVFIEELGPNPTLDELRSLVVENKRRPKLPKPWIRNVHSVALWETLEDCWDADSEARLSAHCAEQRLWNLRQTTLHQCCEEP